MHVLPSQHAQHRLGCMVEGRPGLGMTACKHQQKNPSSYVNTVLRIGASRLLACMAFDRLTAGTQHRAGPSSRRETGMMAMPTRSTCKFVGDNAIPVRHRRDCMCKKIQSFLPQVHRVFPVWRLALPGVCTGHSARHGELETLGSHPLSVMSTRRSCAAQPYYFFSPGVELGAYVPYTSIRRISDRV